MIIILSYIWGAYLFEIPAVREDSIFRQNGPLEVYEISEDVHVGAIRIFPGITQKTVSTNVTGSRESPIDGESST